jgi:hypothetical protein
MISNKKVNSVNKNELDNAKDKSLVLYDVNSTNKSLVLYNILNENNSDLNYLTGFLIKRFDNLTVNILEEDDLDSHRENKLIELNSTINRDIGLTRAMLNDLMDRFRRE